PNTVALPQNAQRPVGLHRCRGVSDFPGHVGLVTDPCPSVIAGDRESTVYPFRGIAGIRE
ncbi:hypothetical protein, partial [Escherichia coli]|uniref:hypothetical protein n=1 Tax=Escherichia coli TaxID=562 RepID=UPI001BEBF53D